jgi:hypothetical protein
VGCGGIAAALLLFVFARHRSTTVVGGASGRLRRHNRTSPDGSADAAAGDSAAGAAEAARAARLAKLAGEPAPEPAAAGLEPVGPISEALAHAVAGVVIGSEQLPELIELVEMVESLSKEAGRRAAAGLWASKDPKGLPPSWVMASYFDSFGRWLLAPAAAEVRLSHFSHPFLSPFSHFVLTLISGAV